MKLTRKRLAIAGALAAVAAAIVVPLALGAVTATGTLSHYDAKMHDRVFRAGEGAQDCHGSLPNPGNYDDGGATRSYDKYSFKNTATTGKCGHVVLNQFCFASGNQINAFATAHTSFDPTNPSANWLGDAGSSDPTQVFNFPLAAGQSFVVVVGAVWNESEGGSFPCPYSITVTIGGVQQPPASTAHVTGSSD
jgi:hypothetical protein